jgi:hypothetical protein
VIFFDIDKSDEYAYVWVLNSKKATLQLMKQKLNSEGILDEYVVPGGENPPTFSDKNVIVKTLDLEPFKGACLEIQLDCYSAYMKVGHSIWLNLSTMQFRDRRYEPPTLRGTYREFGTVEPETEFNDKNRSITETNNLPVNLFNKLINLEIEEGSSDLESNIEQFKSTLIESFQYLPDYFYFFQSKL